jgi:Ca-activated chloride channel family protein
MDGARLAALQQAVNGLTGADDSLSGRFARFRAREQVTIITFNDRVQATREFTVHDSAAGSADLRAISDYANALRAGGNTAIYSALSAAYDAAAAGIRLDPGALTSVVLMTDGENNRGLSSSAFLDGYLARPPDVRGIRTFAIVFGDADRDELTQIATTTGGAVFDATAPGVSLSDAFREIRGYQ